MATQAIDATIFCVYTPRYRKTHKCLRTNFFSGNAAVRYPYIRINF